MLQWLKTQGIGPCSDPEPIEFGDRLNLLTGDNGIGKTFLLDVAWFALTGHHGGPPPWPRPDA
ncbi:MAG: AAA family ATPase, partial [Polyangiaceae bacterium]|nr:AAA family ATPase [Polyangiaceae bacterium]